MDDALVRKLTDIILKNIQNESFSVENLAREAGMSRTTIHRKIRAIKNQDSSQFIREIRLRRAMELLRQNAGTVSEISFMVGFVSPAYFNKCFRDFFGQPPGLVKQESNHEPAASNQDQPEEYGNTGRKRERRYILISFTFLLLISLLSAIYLLFFRDARVTGSRHIEYLKKSIAILPFRNLSDTAADQYFIDGIMEDILANLSKVRDLQVICRTSTEQFRNSAISASEIGKKLDVNYIVEGSGQRHLNTFHLRVHLIDARKNRQIWAGSFDQKILGSQDIYSLQNQIAQTIASELQANITPEEIHIIQKSPTGNLASYDLYLRANEYKRNFQLKHTINDFYKAVSFYEAALEIDSNFAKAFTGLAGTYFERYSWEDYFEKDYLDTCILMVNKALEIDDQLDEAWYLKGLYSQAKGDMQAALDNLDRAISLNPNFFSAFERKGLILFWIMHDNVNGLKNHQVALNLTRGVERCPILWLLGLEYVNIGFLEKAKSCVNEAFALCQNEKETFFLKVWISYCLGDTTATLDMAKKLSDIDSLEITPLLMYTFIPGHDREAYTMATRFIRNKLTRDSLFINILHRIAYPLWQAGKVEEAKTYFNQQISYAEESIRLNRDYAIRNYAAYDLAGCYAFLGNKAKAYQYLDQFDRNKSCQLVWFIIAKQDPLFASIRNEEHFKRILRNMETKYLAEHERVGKWMESGISPSR